MDPSTSGHGREGPFVGQWAEAFFFNPPPVFILDVYRQDIKGIIRHVSIVSERIGRKFQFFRAHTLYIYLNEVYRFKSLPMYTYIVY